VYTPDRTNMHTTHTHVRARAHARAHTHTHTHRYTHTCTHTHTHTCRHAHIITNTHPNTRQHVLCAAYTGWRRPIGCLSCRSFFAKDPLIIGFFCGKWPVKIRPPVGLRRPMLHADTTTHPHIHSVSLTQHIHMYIHHHQRNWIFCEKWPAT